MRYFRLSSGRMLSGLGAAALCCSGTHVARAGQQNKLRPDSRQPGLKQIAVVSGKRTVPPTEHLKQQFGDITFVDADKWNVDLGKGTTHWVGAHTEIEVPDKASKSVLYVHADDILGSRVGKMNIGLIVLSGNVRYRLVQKSDAGDRVLEGTAGHAELRRATKLMEFTGGVHTKLTDAEQFRGPATLRTGSLTVAMETKPFRYSLEGVAANNDIQFTPQQAAASKTDSKPASKADGKPAPPTPLGTFHAYGFRSGDLQIGEAIHLQGAGTTCEFASPDEKTAWRLQGEQLEGEFVPKKSEIQRATVTQNVRYHVSQPSKDKKTQTTVDGTAPQASYVRTQAGQETVVHGPLTMNLDDLQHLAKPAVMTAGQRALLTVKKSGESLSWELIDPDHTQTLQFEPKPFDLEETKPAAPPKPN